MDKKSAFSLVELLISLIIVSLIIAAFAPIMTKKLNRSTALGGSTGDAYEGVLLGFGNFSQDGLYNCAQTENGLFTECTFKVPEMVTEINAVLVGGGGGGAGGLNFSDTKDKEFSAVLPASSNNIYEKLPVTDYMYNLRIQTFITPGAPGGSAVSDALHWSGGGGGASGTILNHPYYIPENILNACKRREYKSSPCAFVFQFHGGWTDKSYTFMLIPTPYIVPYISINALSPLKGGNNATLEAAGKGGQGWHKYNFYGEICEGGFINAQIAPYITGNVHCLDSSTFHQVPGTDGTFADLTPVVTEEGDTKVTEVTYPADPINGKGGHTGFVINGYEYGKGGDGGSAGKWVIAPKPGNDGYAKLLYDEIEPGAAGGGGSGACASRIEKIKVTPKTEVKITIGAGGLGGALSENGQNGQDSSVEYGSDFKIVTTGGFGGKTPSGPNIQGEASQENVCTTSNDKLTTGQILFRYPGKQGGAGIYDEEVKTAQGGLGGLSGFSEIGGFAHKNGGCGGYFSGVCANTTKDGLSASLKEPEEKTLYKTHKYGTLGSGGGGGGWKFDLDNPQPAGVGGDGLDGFVYLYWRKVGK